MFFNPYTALSYKKPLFKAMDASFVNFQFILQLTANVISFVLFVKCQYDSKESYKSITSESATSIASTTSSSTYANNSGDVIDVGDSNIISILLKDYLVDKSYVLFACTFYGCRARKYVSIPILLVTTNTTNPVTLLLLHLILKSSLRPLLLIYTPSHLRMFLLFIISYFSDSFYS